MTDAAPATQHNNGIRQVKRAGRVVAPTDAYVDVQEQQVAAQATQGLTPIQPYQHYLTSNSHCER